MATFIAYKSRKIQGRVTPHGDIENCATITFSIEIDGP